MLCEKAPGLLQEGHSEFTAGAPGPSRAGRHPLILLTSTHLDLHLMYLLFSKMPRKVGTILSSNTIIKNSTIQANLSSKSQNESVSKQSKISTI